MPRFIPIQEVVDLPMLGNHDVLKRDKGRLLKWAKYVWNDLNLSAIKITKREIIAINKLTNSLQLPDDSLRLSTISLIYNGVFYPVYRNDNVGLHDDMIDVAAKKDCACEFQCGNQLCNTIKGYEAVASVKSDVLPNGTPISFNCVDRKVVDSGGTVYQQSQYPKRIYNNGIWTSTVLYTENTKLCQVQVDPNGCVCDTQANVDALCTSCGIANNNPALLCVGGTSTQPPTTTQNTWTYFCNSKADWLSVQCGCYPVGFNNVYNISELGNRVQFPKDFGFNKVLVRYYADVNLKDMQIPLDAVDTFVDGLLWYDVRWDKKMQRLAPVYEMNYTKRKWGLLGEYNKYSMKELAAITTPSVFVPSYMDINKDQFGNRF